jgi:predicted nucleotidyltransferase
MDPMNSIDHIIRIIAESREQLRSEFGVIGIGIFGSVVRGEQGAGSDIDILVEFERPIGFVRFMGLEKRLAELVGMPVDLVTKKALKPHIGKRILQEVRYV